MMAKSLTSCPKPAHLLVFTEGMATFLNRELLISL